jgi:hypothetical protein
MPKQQMQQKQSVSQENGAKLTSTKKRGSHRQTIPAKERLRVIVSEPAEPRDDARIGDNTSTRPWLLNPIILFAALALLALAGIEIFVLTQL